MADSSTPAVAKNFYYWKDVFPELQVLLDNIEIIAEEQKNISKVRPLPLPPALCSDPVPSVGALAGGPLLPEQG